MHSIRVVAAAVLVVGASAFPPATADAAENVLTTAEVYGTALFVRAAPGFSNNISVIRNVGTQAASEFLVTDLAGILPGSGCIPVTPVAVHCSRLGVFDWVQVEAGDQNDTISVDGSTSAFGEPIGVTVGYLVSGGDGNDTISGSPGTSTTFYFDGDAGSDTLYGTARADELDGGQDSDFLYGRDGDDRLEGGGAADWVYGEAGRDDVYGEGDYYSGPAGDDYVDGGAGDDWLVYGGPGNDTVVGGPGEDWLNGGDGDDYYRAQDGYVDDLFCDGVGTDSWSIDFNLDYLWYNCP